MGTVQILRNNDADNSNLLLKENVEALTNGDVSPCVKNINGYKEWNTSGFLSHKKNFYDCCTILREGYKPSGICQE